MRVSTCALLDPRMTALSQLLIGSMKGEGPEKEECGVFYNLEIMMSSIKLEFYYLKHKIHEGAGDVTEEIWRRRLGRP